MAEFHQSQYSTNVKIVQVQWKSYIILHEMNVSQLIRCSINGRQKINADFIINLHQ